MKVYSLSGVGTLNLWVKRLKRFYNIAKENRILSALKHVGGDICEGSILERRVPNYVTYG
jgi:hypothetical protein